MRQRQGRDVRLGNVVRECEGAEYVQKGRIVGGGRIERILIWGEDEKENTRSEGLEGY